jgi:hypothetical protein
MGSRDLPARAYVCSFASKKKNRAKLLARPGRDSEDAAFM